MYKYFKAKLSDYKISSATGYCRIDQKEFGDKIFKFFREDFEKAILRPGAASMLGEYSKGYTIQVFKVNEGTATGSFSSGIDNPVTQAKLDRDFIKDQARKLLNFLNTNIAESQIKSKEGAAYLIMKYLGKNKNIMCSEAQVLKNVNVSRDIYRNALPALSNLNLILTDGHECRFLKDL